MSLHVKKRRKYEGGKSPKGSAHLEGKRHREKKRDQQRAGPFAGSGKKKKKKRASN